MVSEALGFLARARPWLENPKTVKMLTLMLMTSLLVLPAASAYVRVEDPEPHAPSPQIPCLSIAPYQPERAVDARANADPAGQPYARVDAGAAGVGASVSCQFGASPVLFVDGFETGELSAQRWQTGSTTWPAVVASACPPRGSYPGGAPYPTERFYALYKEDTGWANPDRLLATVPIAIPAGASGVATLSFDYAVCSDDVGELTVRYTHSDGTSGTLNIPRRVYEPTHASANVPLIPGGKIVLEFWSNSGLMLDNVWLIAQTPQG